MVHNEGNAAVYIGGGEGRPLPLATGTYRKAHTPRKPKPTGLDWSKHRAPDAAPDDDTTATKTTTGRHRYGTTISADVEDLLESRFTAPTRSLEADLQVLEQTDPDVVAAAASYDAVVDVILHPQDHHVQAPSEPVENREAPKADEQETATPEPRTGGFGVPVPDGSQTSPAAVLDRLIDELATTRAMMATDLARIENALEAVRQALITTPADPPAPVATPATSTSAATGFQTFRKPQRRTARPRAPRVDFDAATVVRRYQNLETVGAIAASLGASTSTIRRALQGAGVTLRDDRARNSGGRNAKTIDDYPQDLVDSICDLYTDQLHTTTQIAEETGHSPKFVSTILKRAGITMRPSASAPGHKGRDQKLDDAKRAQICDRYQAGESSLALATAYGVSSPTILNLLRARGVPIRRRGGNHLTQTGDPS